MPTRAWGSWEWEDDADAPVLLEVDEHAVNRLIAEKMAAWGVELARAMDAHITAVLNKLRGRVD